MYIWDEAKNVANIAKHGVDFSWAYEFDEDHVAVFDRTRESDGEDRYAAIGFLRGKLHPMIYTPRGEDSRVISLRRSNNKEEKTYEKIAKG